MRFFRRLRAESHQGLLAIKPTGPEEWFEVRGWKTGATGLIPRSVCEEIGIDCSPADQIPRGTIWFTKEQVEKIHRHPRWESLP